MMGSTLLIGLNTQTFELGLLRLEFSSLAQSTSWAKLAWSPMNQ